jgi:S-adenosyl-L-methionine hydrolase (adenosine-forming)
MIVLFTDFGLAGPYTGQVKAVLHERVPGVPVIDLFADAPACNPRAASYLLAAYAGWFPRRSVILAIVDPGVGGARAPLVASADGRWFVGPDNGLFEIVLRRAEDAQVWEIAWRPENLSATFHGRDLFAPVAALIARGEAPAWTARPVESARRPDWPEDLLEIVYIDHYGNAMIGTRAAHLPKEVRLRANGRLIPPARSFADARAGDAVWYENSNGLAEIGVNLGRADATLGLAIGSTVAIET